MSSQEIAAVDAEVVEHLPVLREQPAELSVEELVAQVAKIQAAQAAAMKDGEHFGVIPGTNKPTLLKPGAEKLCLLFRLDPEYECEERFDPDGHYYVRASCTLFHIPTGNRVAGGLGSCTTRETKYAFRTANRKCPACGAEAIIKGKTEYGGGWLCFKKKGGCGDKFDDGAEVIESQETGRVENENLADTYNTVLKMACKRALIAAVLNGTAASDIFTQDLEDAGSARESDNKAESQRGAVEKPKQMTREEALAEFMERRVKLARLDKAWTREQILSDVSARTGTVVKDWNGLPDEELGRLLRAARQASSGIEENLGIDKPESEFKAPDGATGQAA